MSSDEKDQRKHRKDHFNFFGFDDRFFNDIFDDQMFDDFRRMAEEMFRMMSNAKPGKSYVHGINVRIDPNGKPRFEEFGNRHVKLNKGKSRISEDREPLTDVIEGKEDVSVTVELPGVEKEDIDLRVIEDELEITVDSPKRKYHKIVHLPVDVKPKTTKATYKNGILDVSVQRKKKKIDNDDGFKVNIE